MKKTMKKAMSLVLVMIMVISAVPMSGFALTGDCSINGHTTEVIPGTAPTCTESGITDGEKCSVCNTITVAQDIMPALGHDLLSDTEKSIPATCTTEGYLYLTCSRCSTIEEWCLPPLDHAWGEWVETLSPTCDTMGEKERTCTRCNTTECYTISSLGGHTVEMLPGMEVTCTENGLTAGSYCSSCGTIFEVQEVIPALGHVLYDYEYEIIQRATFDNNGSYGFVCERCYESVDPMTIPRIDGDSIELSETVFEYDGYRKTPYVTVYDIEGNELEEDVDYYVEYDSGRINPGEYNVEVIFVGKYAGSTTLTFRIEASLMIYSLYSDGNYTTVDLDWYASDDAEVYRIYQYNNGVYNIIDMVSDTYYRVRDLQPNTSYWFAVQAGRVDENGKFVWGYSEETYVRTTRIPLCDHIDNNADKLCDDCGEEALRFAGNYAGTQFKLYMDGTLVISGTGNAYCRWKNYREYIKSAIVEEGITGLDAGCFAVCTNMKTVSLPSTLKMIGDQAFYACESLETIDIPNSVKMFGESVFSGCVSLDSLTIPEGVKELYYYFASGCTALDNVKLPSTLVAIGDGAFADCISLKEIELPDNLERINGAFNGCISLEKIEIPYGVITIGGYTFAGCKKLKEITLPDSVTELGYLAFNDCTKLENVKLSSNLTKIDVQTFGSCVNLKSLTLPEGVTEIGSMAFDSCENLEYIYIPEIVNYIGYGAFARCKNLKSINIPDALTSIGWAVFYGLESITEVTIPSNVTLIADVAFAGCTNLEKVTMYNNVEEIISIAFEGCDKISDVYFYGTEEEWSAIDIWDDNEELLNATIHFLNSSSGHSHTLKNITVPATCNSLGMQYDVCTGCGMIFGSVTMLPATHTPGNWTIVSNPTYVSYGERVIKCVACGEILEKESIAPLKKITVSDDNTGISVELDPANYSGDVAITVAQSFDNAAFSLINSEIKVIKTALYDINMTVGGLNSQPNGKITVSIPVPTGYNPSLCYVYYLNPAKGVAEKITTRYENGNLVFETDHFSYYAVVEVPDMENCSCRCHNTGFVGKLIWFVVNFFNKIMKKNQICGCGIYHY